MRAFGSMAQSARLARRRARNPTRSSRAYRGDAATVATNLAYPLGDLLLLSGVVGVLASRGWRPGRAWFVIALGLLMYGLADSTYLHLEAKGAYVEGGVMDLLARLFSSPSAAWSHPQRPKAIELEGPPPDRRPIPFRALRTCDAYARRARGIDQPDCARAGHRNSLCRTPTHDAVRTENLRLIDVTERASCAKSDFLANMSHERGRR